MKPGEAQVRGFAERGWGSNEGGSRFVLVEYEVAAVHPVVDILKAVNQVGWWSSV